MNVGAPYFIIQLALPLMGDGGRIINIGSGVARMAVPGEPVHSMAGPPPLLREAERVPQRWLGENRARQGISADR
ncbi:hypothetical protein [Streptomyces sp. NPDC020480]|uniref:hypothetical protein n=1 Tax=Streptomyces sp. NPDC020480 TaxID=3365076 RepID=UPI0037A2137C